MISIFRNDCTYSFLIHVLVNSELTILYFTLNCNMTAVELELEYGLTGQMTDRTNSLYLYRSKDVLIRSKGHTLIMGQTAHPYNDMLTTAIRPVSPYSHSSSTDSLTVDYSKVTYSVD